MPKLKEPSRKHNYTRIGLTDRQVSWLERKEKKDGVTTPERVRRILDYIIEEEEKEKEKGKGKDENIIKHKEIGASNFKAAC